MPRKPKRPRQSQGGEYRFKIDAYTPTTIPMLRLAEYMHQLAQILGEPAHVHFCRLAKGSTSILHTVEHEAIPKVRERISRLRQGDGPSEVLRAYKAANKLLREDNAVGALKLGAVVLPFPGIEEAQEEFASVRQQGFVDGIVTGVRGRDETVHITLQAEDKQISGCYTSRAIAKQLGAKLYEAVRLFGKGKWVRDSEGIWTIDDFKVESFEPLDEAPLTAALAGLRAIPTEWDDNAYGELGVIRHGPKGKRNGGH
jgi:hypothetical protein